ncbi:MAG: hypothetical protein II845_06330 [Oscillospiraceae bacterium]|nr:hypothetical protein [Oscillospiraceae bacterium]
MYLLETDYSPPQCSFRGRPQKPLLILQDFLRRDRQVMEVSFTRYEYKDAVSCRSTLAKAIKYYHLDGQIGVRVSGRKVYLVRLSSKEVSP